DRLLRRDEHVERRGDREPARTHFPTDEHVESGASAGRGRHQRDVLRLAVRAILEAAGHRDVKFARQIGKFGIAVAADDPAIELEYDGRGIEQLVRRDPGERTAVDVADVVHPGLKAGKIHPAQPLPDFLDRVEGEAAKLDLLTGGEVERAVAETRRQVGDGAQLLARREAVRHPDAQHEAAGRARSREPYDGRGSDCEGAACGVRSSIAKFNRPSAKSIRNPQSAMAWPTMLSTHRRLATKMSAARADVIGSRIKS